MPRRNTKKERGVFEKDPGSEIWWIRYYIDGRERREKVDRKKDASDLYKIRKADALRGVKLPDNMKNKGVKFEVLGKHAIDWYIEHGRKDIKNFRIRMNIILKDFGDRIADEILPSEIDAWLKGHDWSPATKNRYKNVFGKTFKIAYADGKVSSNPARLVEQRPEKNARLRFLSADEELRLRDAITKRCPQHMPELDIGLNTGMRKANSARLESTPRPFRVSSPGVKIIRAQIQRTGICSHLCRTSYEMTWPLSIACASISLAGKSRKCGTIYSRITMGSSLTTLPRRSARCGSITLPR